MQNTSSPLMGEIIKLRNALSARDQVQVDQLLGSSHNLESLSHSLRYSLAHYCLDVDGVPHTKNSVIWAVPFLLNRNSNRFISTEGGLQKVFTPESRQYVRRVFGLQYEVASYDGLIHSDMLSMMPVTSQAILLNCLVGAGSDDKQPEIALTKNTAERIEAGAQPELAFMVGSVSRYQRQPDLSLAGLDQMAFKERMRGQVALQAKDGFIDLSHIVAGVPARLEDAVKAGYEMLLNALACEYSLCDPVVEAIDANTYVLRLQLIAGDIHIERSIAMNSSIIGIDAMADIYAYSQSLCDGKLCGSVGRPRLAQVLH